MGRVPSMGKDGVCVCVDLGALALSWWGLGEHLCPKERCPPHPHLSFG